MTDMKQVLILKSIALSLVVTTVVSLGYIAFEPTFAQAVAPATDSVIVTLDVQAGISITSPADTTMSTNLGVITNTAVATTTWNVKTNSAGGYTLGVAASTNPAMQVSSTIYVEDYPTTTAPTTWNVAAGAAKFGFSATGTDVNTTKWGTGNFCQNGTSTPSATLKYTGFYTVATTTSLRTSTTTTNGIDTTICYAVEQDTFYIPSGSYSATITATATAT
jgi:hypothetical protein